MLLRMLNQFILLQSASCALIIKKKVEEELERLQAEGTVEPVQFAEWAAPIVLVVKEDKSVQICGDCKVTINQAAKLDNYPIPKAEDLFATLSGGDKLSA